MKERSHKAQPIQIVHGGRVYEAARRWGIDPAEVVDFSTNINPLGPPQRALSAIENALTAAGFRVYPDDHAFVGAIADKHRLMPDEIVVSSGAASLTFAVMHAILPKRVLLLEPAFGEYRRACTAVNAEVTTWLLTEESGFTPDFASLGRAIKERQFDLVILNSPHNPTGAFYSMPGLRIGYATCSARLAAMMRRQIDPWSVSTVALEAGRVALDEDGFGAESCRINAIAREELARALCAVGLEVLPSAANFLLAKLPHGSGGDLQDCLESERILIRRCDSFHGLGDAFIRLAVRARSDNMRLVSLIEKWLKGE